jgi:hypothetical protein
MIRTAPLGDNALLQTVDETQERGNSTTSPHGGAKLSW